MPPKPMQPESPEAQPTPLSGSANTSGENTPLATQRIAEALTRRRRWLWLGVGVLYLLSFNGQWRITPDSANYLIVAKTFADQGRLDHPLDFADNIGPGFPILMGYLIRFVGPEGFWAFDLAMLLLVPVNLALVFWLMRLYADDETAVVVTLLAGIAHGFFSAAFYLLADWPFVTGVLIYLVGLGYLEKQTKRWWAWVPLMLLGLAVTACLRSVFFVLPLATLIGLPIYWIQRRQFTRLAWLAVGGAVTIGVIVLLPESFLGWMRGDVRMLTQSLIGQLPATISRLGTETWWVFLSEVLPRAPFGIDLGPVPNLALSALLLVAVVRLVRMNLIWALMILGYMAQALLFYTSRRYLLPVLPLLAYAWWDLLCAIEGWGAARRVGPSRWPSVLAVGMFWFWIVANPIKAFDFAFEQQSRPFWDHYRSGRYIGFAQACDTIRQHTPSNSLILSRRKWTPSLMYLTGRVTIDTPAPSLAKNRSVFALLPLDNIDQASLLEQHGWWVEHEQAIPIDPQRLPGLLLAPVRIAPPNLIHEAVSKDASNTVPKNGKPTLE